MFDAVLANEIRSFNQQLSAHESAICENILLACDAISEELLQADFLEGKTPAQKTAWINRYQQWLLTNLKGMVNAKTAEELTLYQEGFNEALRYLPIKPEAKDLTAIKMQQMLASFEEVLLTLSDEFVQQNTETKRKFLEEWVASGRLDNFIKTLAGEEKEHFIALKKHLESILLEDNVARFQQKREDLLQAIRHDKHYDDKNHAYLQRVSTLATQNASLLASARLNYLESVTSKKAIAKDFAWMIAGIGVIVAGVFFPPLSAAAIGLGIAGVGYGAMDFSKGATEAISKETMPKLGKKEPGAFSEETQALLTTPKPKTPLSPAEKVVKTMRKRAGLMMSGAGLGVAAGALLMVLPGLVFPPALPFILLGVGLGLAVAGGVMYAREVYKARQEIKKTQAKRDAMRDHVKQDLGEDISLTQKEREQLTNAEQAKEKSTLKAKHAHIETTALIEKELLGLKVDEHVSAEQQHELSEKLEEMQAAPWPEATPSQPAPESAGAPSLQSGELEKAGVLPAQKPAAEKPPIPELQDEEGEDERDAGPKV